jgi:predicted dehydrogenase
MAIEAMNQGKDVYLEKPMTHTVDEPGRLLTVDKTKRVLQVDRKPSSDQWWKARKAIEDGMIGQLIMSQVPITGIQLRVSGIHHRTGCGRRQR